ncbi:MAG: hypothetical protein VX346_15925, partial [Planctomycetota bacterium]|nr:hypothetical protein [Planctomycetota bacterium]
RSMVFFLFVDKVALHSKRTWQHEFEVSQRITSCAKVACVGAQQHITQAQGPRTVPQTGVLTMVETRIFLTP